MEVSVERLRDGGADQLAAHVVGAFHLAFVFQFEFAGDGRQGRVDVADARNDDSFPMSKCAPLGVRDHVLGGGNREALAHARALINFFVFPSKEGDPLDHLLHVFGNLQTGAMALDPGFLCGDGDAFFDRRGIVSADFRTDAVFQRRNDLAAGGVVLGIGAEDDGDIERQADGISLNLHVAFLHDVEQADLNLSRQIGQFVDGEDAAVGAGQQAVVHGELAGEFVSAARRFDRIDVADQVGDGHVGRGQLFHVAMLGSQPGNRRGVFLPGNQFLATLADGRVRVVVNLTARDIGQLGVEQARQGAQDAAFRLSAQPEQNEVMPRQDSVHNLGHHGVVVADDPRKNGAVTKIAQPSHQVLAQLIFHSPGAKPFFRKCTTAQLAESLGNTHGGNPQRKQPYADYTAAQLTAVSDEPRSQKDVICV